jgi:hypothetical protein
MLGSTLLYAGIVPLVVAASVTFVIEQIGASSNAAWAWGVAIGFIAGQFALKAEGGSSYAAEALMRPTSAADWLAILVLLALGVSLLLMAAPVTLRPIVWALAAALCFAAIVRLLANNAQLLNWSVGARVGVLLVLAAGLSSLWILLGPREGRVPSPVQVALLIVVAVGIAMVLTLSGVLVYGQLAGAVAAALAGCGVVGTLGRGDSTAAEGGSRAGVSGAAGIVVLTLTGLLVLGHFYASLSTRDGVLLFAAIAAAGMPLPGVTASAASWKHVPIRAALCISPLAIAVAGVSW